MGKVRTAAAQHGLEITDQVTDPRGPSVGTLIFVVRFLRGMVERTSSWTTSGGGLKNECKVLLSFYKKAWPHQQNKEPYVTRIVSTSSCKAGWLYKTWGT